VSKRGPVPLAAPQPLKVGDTVTAPSWDGFTAKIIEISPYIHHDGSNWDCALFEGGGFWRLSALRLVDVQR
jgi:hypothetical protein